VEETHGSRDSLQREIDRERLKNARRSNTVRFWGVSAFFLLFLILGGVLRLPEWSGNLPLFALYWLATTVIFLVSRRSERIVLASGMAVALFDAPIVFFLQWATFPTSNASGVAGFTVGVYVLLVMLAAFSLQRWYVIFTAVVVTVYEILLQHFAGVSVGAMLSTVILIGLAAAICSYAQYRLLRFVQRIDRHMRAHREAEAARRQAERVSALAALARELSGTLDPATVAERTVESIVRLLGARNAILFRLDPASGDLVSVATVGLVGPAFPLGSRLPAGAGATGQAVLRREVVITSDVLAEPGIAMPPAFENRLLESNHRAACAVPLIVRGTVTGALRVSDVAGRRFTDDEVHLAQAFADHAAFSLENARLYAELDAHLHQLETTQEQLLQAGKLAAVGQLVTGIAHEINNPLATIMGQAEMLGRRLSDPGPLERVTKIADCAMRAAKIVRGLQTFVRPRPHKMAPLDLRDVVARVVSLREDAMRFNGVDLLEDLAEDVPPVLGDASQLDQVVLNLVINAEQAVAAATTPRIAIGVGVHDSRVRLTVSDTGPGIPADILPRIFEPFFSTKAPNQNSGLGLSISYSIVQNHGGRLIAESAPGGGATFSVELPAHRGPVPVPLPRSDPDGPPLRRGTILVVEDEPHVAGMLRDLLTDLGQEVTVVADAASTWRILVEEAKEFDAITLDLRLSGLSGRTIFERLERELPRMAARVLFVTGENADLDSEAFLEHSGRPTLRKPFGVKALIAGLATLLAHRAASTDR
jgi:C4-dicarboxylate-specific signal transduction histidine kinase/CheY-like chemotaxis protein